MPKAGSGTASRNGHNGRGGDFRAGCGGVQCAYHERGWLDSGTCLRTTLISASEAGRSGSGTFAPRNDHVKQPDVQRQRRMLFSCMARSGVSKEQR